MPHLSTCTGGNSHSHSTRTQRRYTIIHKKIQKHQCCYAFQKTLLLSETASARVFPMSANCQSSSVLKVFR